MRSIKWCYLQLPVITRFYYVNFLIFIKNLPIVLISHEVHRIYNNEMKEKKKNITFVVEGTYKLNGNFTHTHTHSKTMETFLRRRVRIIGVETDREDW